MKEMDDVSSRSSLRDRILNDLRSTVKQIYHESVNNELSLENKSYLCFTLIKNLDEALRHGLKQLHLGYWRPVQRILHPQILELIEKLPSYSGFENNCMIKGRTWIAVSLRDDSFVSYAQCLTKEVHLDKFYETWSILRNNDTCNRFLSILSGLENVIFHFQIEYVNKPPSSCSFVAKDLNNEKDKTPKNLNVSKTSINLTTSSSTLTSPVDSGVHIQDSSSDTEQFGDDKQTEIDFLNGNVPESVILRKRAKDTKRHVSFHEDIIFKSPDKCRKLKWDAESLRYSWSGEEIDSSILCDSDFAEIKSKVTTSTPTKNVLDIKERGVPEGEETPSDVDSFKSINKTHKSIVVKRFLQSIKKQSKIKQLSKKYDYSASQPLLKAKIDLDLVNEINVQIEKELEEHRKISRPKFQKIKFEVDLKSSVVENMINRDALYKSYVLRDYLFVMTNKNVYLINKNLHTRKIKLLNLKEIVIFPDAQRFSLTASDSSVAIVTGDENLTDEIIGRLELCMRRNFFELPHYKILRHGDMHFFRRTLVDRGAIGKTDRLLYYGCVRLDKENESLDSVTPNWKRGFLMYRDNRAGDSWKPGDFMLKGGILYLFADENGLPKLAVNLSASCRSCSRTQNPDRPHTFQITLTNNETEFRSVSNCFYEDGSLKKKMSKSDTRRLFSEIRQKVNHLLAFGSDERCCTIEFAAADEYDMSDWLQMIIQASCGDGCEDASKDDVIDSTLLLTTDSLVIISENVYPEYYIQILSCAQLSDIAAFKMGESEKDFFTVIEFHCMEATSTSGDLIIYMNSREELEKLRRIMQRLWRLNTRFPSCYLTEDRLIRKCRKTQENLFDNCWTHLYG